MWKHSHTLLPLVWDLSPALYGWQVTSSEIPGYTVLSSPLPVYPYFDLIRRRGCASAYPIHVPDVIHVYFSTHVPDGPFWLISYYILKKDPIPFRILESAGCVEIIFWGNFPGPTTVNVKSFCVPSQRLKHASLAVDFFSRMIQRKFCFTWHEGMFVAMFLVVQKRQEQNCFSFLFTIEIIWFSFEYIQILSMEKSIYT